MFQYRDRDGPDVAVRTFVEALRRHEMRDPDMMLDEVGVDEATLPEDNESARDPGDYSGALAEKQTGASEVDQPELLPEVVNADVDVHDPGVLGVALDTGNVIERDSVAD